MDQSRTVDQRHTFSSDVRVLKYGLQCTPMRVLSIERHLSVVVSWIYWQSMSRVVARGDKR